QMKKQRATWKRADEKLLLKCYLAARNDASLKTDKGVKSKGWAKIVARLAKEGSSADKAAQRTARVKRYRDGRKKNASGASRSREGMEAFFATAERYFQLKADLLAKQLASQDTSQVD
ncbi:hypothetical protein PR002_g32005, partial [Phytophthora rubi]